MPGSGYVPPSTSSNNPLIDGWEGREQIQDHSAQNYDDTINGVTRYQGPDGEEQLPSGHDSAWAGDDGSRIMSDDPGYDPNVGSGSTTYTPMDPSSSSSSSSSDSD
jgi:hypothetical protein